MRDRKFCDVRRIVSTHSRPKAAGANLPSSPTTYTSFNTQPPEGGWYFRLYLESEYKVSTHSRPKAAGFPNFAKVEIIACFNTRPPEGGWTRITVINEQKHFVSTHSRPKAAGCKMVLHCNNRFGFNTQPPEGGWAPDLLSALSPNGFNTQPPEGGWLYGLIISRVGLKFQHTAARRRLAPTKIYTA